MASNGFSGRHRTTVRLLAMAVAAVALLASCGSAGGGSGSSGNAKVALILKEFTNPYFVYMEKAAKAEAKKDHVDLTVTAGNSDSDTSDQINQIQDAVSAGDKAIIITTDGDAVNASLDRAKQQGVLVVALDTAPIPASTADVTYQTDNLQAGTLIGKWAAAKLNGAPATIALLDDVQNEVLSVDVDRDHGFLTGMGIPVGDKSVNGKEPTSGHYTGGKGGSYQIVCQLPTEGTATEGQSAMETCLSKNPNINLVYSINEPAAEGAVKALQSAGDLSKVTVVSIDGGCSNLPYVAKHQIGATAGQFPGKMSADGVDAAAKFARSGTKPKMSPGLSYYNTGTQLYTDEPMPGQKSITTSAASKLCWG